MAEGKTLVQTCDDPEEQRKLQRPDASEFYHYWTLPEPGWFRLLVVEPSPDPQFRISCSLLYRPIKECEDYEALSYTWGTDIAITPILIDGSTLLIPTPKMMTTMVMRLHLRMRLLGRLGARLRRLA